MLQIYSDEPYGTKSDTESLINFGKNSKIWRMKDEEIKAALQEFADVLEEFVKAYPFQWFAFRDVWKSNE